jgi:hypothetical protein
MAVGTAALIFTGVSAGISAYSRWKAGKAEKKAGEAQQRSAEAHAELEDFNAAVADLQAKDAVARGLVEEQRYRQQIDQVIGAQRVGFAAGNIDTGYGSAVDVQADAAYIGELDALTIRTNAAREAWGYRVEAADLRKRAEITRREGGQLAEAGRERQKAARLEAVTGVVATAGNLLGSRYGFGRRAA